MWGGNPNMKSSWFFSLVLSYSANNILSINNGEIKKENLSGQLETK